ncbi:ESX secretion-associated protein EspG [Actinokineospora iranica]|uniref:EspG family protein n=1 Tax=Actinokineospora iranica TaxID=1271860 RepID=A0A1G6RAX6_9PSEU|nr:ESX secretion-associated protein EspG [Actinokineospora iranica]SDD01593.1 EspG family protein [Actinokineospora iranica]
MLDKPITLSATSLARVIRAENIGEPHIALAPTASWQPRDAEHTADTRARTEIQRLGGLDRRGRLDADLAATLTLLCKPAVEFYGWLTTGDTTTSVLAAATGRDAVLATRTGDTVHLRQATPDDLPTLLVAQTPDVPPGRGNTVTLTSDDLPSPTHRGSPQVRLAQRIAELPTTGSGLLYTAIRDRLGRRQAATHPLRYIDTVHGRWLSHARPGTGLTIAPADHRALVTRLTDMHRTLTDR